MQKLSVVTMVKLINGWITNDELKVKSYSDFIRSNFPNDKKTKKLLSITSKEDALQIGDELAVEFSLAGKDRCSRIIRQNMEEATERVNKVVLD